MDKGSPITKMEVGRSVIGILVIVVVIVASALLLATPFGTYGHSFW